MPSSAACLIFRCQLLLTIETDACNGVHKVQTALRIILVNFLHDWIRNKLILLVGLGFSWSNVLQPFCELLSPMVVKELNMSERRDVKNCVTCTVIENQH